MANESKIKIVVTGESSSAKKSLDSIEKELKDVGKASKKVSKDVSNVDKSFKGFGKSANLAKAGIAGFVGAIGISTITQAVKEVVNLGDSIGKTADAFGVSTDLLQEFRFVAERTGVSTGIADSSLSRFTKRVGEASQGLGAARKTYERFGISLIDMSGNLRSQESILFDVADAIDSLGSQSEKAAAVSAIFGREGIRLVNTFEGGSAAFRELTKEFEQFGGAISEQAIRKAEDIADKLTNAEVAGRKFKTELVLAFADLIPSATNFLQIWVEGINQIKKITSSEIEINEALSKQERLRIKNNQVSNESSQIIKVNSDEVESIAEKWRRIGQELDVQSGTLSDQQIKQIEIKNKIKDIQNEIDKTTSKYGVIPEVIQNGTRALLTQVDALNKLNEEADKFAGSEAFDTLNLQDYKEHLKSIKGETETLKETTDDLSDFDTSSFDDMNNSLRDSAMLSDRVSRNLDDSSKKAKQFGSALSLDTVGSLALERNLRFAGRGTLPSKNIANAGVAGFGVQSIVPESFQQESRMRALQEVLSQESTLAGSSGFSQEQIQGLRNELQEKFGIGGFGGSGGEGDTNINNVYNISANDASSFRMSQGQILAEQNRVLDQSTRRKRGLVGGNR